MSIESEDKSQSGYVKYPIPVLEKNVFCQEYQDFAIYVDDFCIIFHTHTHTLLRLIIKLKITREKGGKIYYTQILT